MNKVHASLANEHARTAYGCSPGGRFETIGTGNIRGPRAIRFGVRLAATRVLGMRILGLNQLAEAIFR